MMTPFFQVFSQDKNMNKPDEEIIVVNTPTLEGDNRHYYSNRPPLVPTLLLKLPIGAIKPKGWLLSQLKLMKDGFTGHLSEISKFLKPNSGWLTLKDPGWEEMPYWLKGFGDLGYILRDKKIYLEAIKWLDAVINSQEKDGYFGPRENKKNHDLWPNMVMLFAFQSLYDATGDKRVIPLMTKYFKYQLEMPIENLLPESWQKIRGGDNLESIYWFYNRTGDKFLLDLGKRVFERTANWTDGIIGTHGVNITMGIRQPGVYYQQSRDKKHLDAVERNYTAIMNEYGQQPGGMFGADENFRQGEIDPRQAAETCSMVEFMYSNESLLKITGEPKYADRCEEIAFNSLPASMTPDLKGLHYLTAPNLISCDSSGEHNFENPGTLLSYDPYNYRCCQHNVAFGWPYFVEHLWLATLDNGLAAVLYATSDVTAIVAGGTEVTIEEKTEYPFSDNIDFLIKTSKQIVFPLYFRIPDWCNDARIIINNNKVDIQPPSGTYIKITRNWKNKDKVRLEFPMNITVKVWDKIGNAISIRRGPLWYSLKIGEEWKRYGGTDKWQALELLPTTPWNYGLLIDPTQPEESIKLSVTRKVSSQPFDLNTAPIELTTKAKRLPNWKAEGKMVSKVPISPVESNEPVEEITLIPMGCARLRISSFPIVK
jgi:hypothetical protein